MRADSTSGTPEWWRSHPWRLIQTNLREIDMEDIDAGLYVRELQSMHATIAMINTGGIIASYPTGIADHFQSPHLNGSSLEEIISACHDAGIRVIARCDFSKVRRPLYERHPEWAYRTGDGAIVDYNGDVHVCLNGAYQQKVAFTIVSEMLELLDIDGLFFNMGGFLVRDYSYNHYGPCHCASCRRRFEGEYRNDLTEALSPDAPAELRNLHELAKREWVREYDDRMHAHIHELRPDVAVNHYEFMRQESNTEIDRPLPRWQYSASSNTRWAVAGDPERVSSNTTVDFIGFFYRHVAVSPAMQELRLWQNLANGGAVDYYLIGRLDNHRDRSGYGRVRRIFEYHERNEEIYAHGALDSIARTLVIRPRSGLSPEAMGWIRLLTETHVPFSEIRLEDLDAADLGRYTAIVLPDVEEMPSAVCDRVNAWVEAGGRLIASGRPALRNERLERRSKPGIDVGVNRIITERNDMRSSMFSVRPGSFPSLDAAPSELVYLGDRYLFAEFGGGTRGELRLIPPHPYGPPERCYDRDITDLPGVVEQDLGSGRTIYLPWWPGALYHREGHQNTALLLRDIVMNEASAPAIGTNAGPMVEITVHRVSPRGSSRTGAHALLVSLVNTSGHFGTTVHDPVSMRDVRLTIPASHCGGMLDPEAAGAGTVPAGRSLVDGRQVPVSFGRTEGRADGAIAVSVEIDRLDAFEAILIEAGAGR